MAGVSPPVTGASLAYVGARVSGELQEVVVPPLGAGAGAGRLFTGGP